MARTRARACRAQRSAYFGRDGTRRLACRSGRHAQGRADLVRPRSTHRVAARTRAHSDSIRLDLHNVGRTNPTSSRPSASTCCRHRGSSSQPGRGEPAALLLSVRLRHGYLRRSALQQARPRCVQLPHEPHAGDAVLGPVSTSMPRFRTLPAARIPFLCFADGVGHLLDRGDRLAHARPEHRRRSRRPPRSYARHPRGCSSSTPPRSTRGDSTDCARCVARAVVISRMYTVACSLAWA